MSWQSYVDDQLVGTGQISKGIIIGHDGSKWAASSGFDLMAGEGAAIAALFKNPSEVFVKGVTINGVKYMGIKGDESSIYGKKGATGVAIAKTGQVILLGYYDEKVQPGNAVLVVETLGDYLKVHGY